MNPNLDYQNTPVDTRCRLCGAEGAPLMRVTDTRSQRVCWDSAACAARQETEAAWAEQRYVITETGRAALAFVEQAQQLRIGVA